LLGDKMLAAMNLKLPSHGNGSFVSDQTLAAFHRQDISFFRRRAPEIFGPRLKFN
jgi:hypothetical protein